LIVEDVIEINLVPVWVSFGAWILLAFLLVGVARVLLEHLSLSGLSQPLKQSVSVSIVLFISGIIAVSYILPNAAIDFSQVEDQNRPPSLLAIWAFYGGLVLLVGGLVVSFSALLVRGAIYSRRRLRR
jgi:putative flippase GtrA